MSKTIYNFNENYFNTIDTQNKAYLLGILATDGCISTKRNNVSLTLHNKDLEIIEFFKKELQSNNRIYINKEYRTLWFSSKIMKNALMSLNVTNRKTYTLQFPKILSEFNYDFIRGCIDGDGCWHIRNRIGTKGQPIKPGILLQFTGSSYPFLESIQNILMKDTEYTNKIYKIKNKNCYELKFCGSKQCKKIFDMIYYDRTQFCLERKYNIVNSYYKRCESNDADTK